MIAAMAADDRIDATTIQTVGSKGCDGLTIGLVTEPAAGAGTDQDPSGTR